jgi:hypothetical protein
MPTIAVFNVELEHPVKHALTFATLIVDLGDAFEIRGNKNQAYTRADGKGGNTSYKGRNRFTLTFDMMKHINGDGTQEANKLWDFYQSQLAGYQAFYFYNPAERSTPDLTGIDITGRYLVRFMEQELEREQFALNLFRGGISLIEVRA